MTLLCPVCCTARRCAASVPRGVIRKNLVLTRPSIGTILNRHREGHPREKLHRSDRGRSTMSRGRQGQSSRGADSASGASRPAPPAEGGWTRSIEYEPPAVSTIEDSERCSISNLGYRQHFQDVRDLERQCRDAVAKARPHRRRRIHHRRARTALYRDERRDCRR